MSIQFLIRKTDGGTPPCFRSINYQLRKGAQLPRSLCVSSVFRRIVVGRFGWIRIGTRPDCDGALPMPRSHDHDLSGRQPEQHSAHRRYTYEPRIGPSATSRRTIPGVISRSSFRAHVRPWFDLAGLFESGRRRCGVLLIFVIRAGPGSGRFRFGFAICISRGDRIRNGGLGLFGWRCCPGRDIRFLDWRNVLCHGYRRRRGWLRRGNRSLSNNGRRGGRLRLRRSYVGQ